MPNLDEPCKCTCPACIDAECESGCLNERCIDPLCRDADCQARAAEAELIDSGGGAAFVA
jgi:hypothetical protein